MKRTTLLFLCLLLSGAVLGTSERVGAIPDDAFQAFWQKFKSAVINSNKNTVADLSKFPIEMSYGIRSIKTKAELNRRFDEVFSKQTAAVQCFKSKEPAAEEGNAKRYSVACPDSAGNDVVVFTFERTKPGWRFVRLDNINE